MEQPGWRHETTINLIISIGLAVHVAHMFLLSLFTAIVLVPPCNAYFFATHKKYTKKKTFFFLTISCRDAIYYRRNNDYSSIL